VRTLPVLLEHRAAQHALRRQTAAARLLDPVPAQVCPTDPLVRAAIAALLAAWRVAGERKRALELQLVRLARGSDTCQRMVTVPGVGAITTLTFLTAIDDPERFRRSSNVGAFLGLTPRRYQAGEVDLAGRISKAIAALTPDAAHLRSAGARLRNPD
jgi:transposase